MTQLVDKSQGKVPDDSSGRREGLPRRILAPSFHWIACSLIALLGLVLAGFIMSGTIGATSTDDLVLAGMLLAGVTALLAVTATLSLSRSIHQFTQLASNLAPTLLLMTIFPLINDDLETMTGNVRTIAVVMAVAVTTPWITNVVSMPIYEPLGEISRDNWPLFYKRFCQVWVPAFRWAFLPIAIFSGMMIFIFGWGPLETFVYVLGVVANVIFSQSMIALQETKRAALVVASWGVYAGFMALVPVMWWLAPFMGALVPLIVMRAQLHFMLSPVLFHRNVTLNKMLLGFLMGSVLWSDKFMLILAHPGRISVYAIYVALLPVVLAQSVYFAAQYKTLQRGIRAVSVMVEETPASKLDRSMDYLSKYVENSIAITMTLATLGGVALFLVLPVLGISYEPEFVALIGAPIVFLFLNLETFQMAQLKMNREAAILSAVHLSLIVVVFLIFPIPKALLIVSAVDLVLSIWAVGHCRRTLANSAYSLFWREATKW